MKKVTLQRIRQRISLSSMTLQTVQSQEHLGNLSNLTVVRCLEKSHLSCLSVKLTQMPRLNVIPTIVKDVTGNRAAAVQ